MKNVKRIAVIGNAGSGKSTLTQKLHKILELPIYHLDKYFWKPNWGRPDPHEYKIVHDTICDQDKWIMDGMNLKLLEYRIKKSDVVIFLDIPRYICFWRIFKRMFKYYGKVTPTSAEQCPERLNWDFLKFLKWIWDFKAKYRPKIIDLLNAYANTKEIYILKSPKEIERFIDTLQQG
jgi:adenylate kinase family enzyme